MTLRQVGSQCEKDWYKVVLYGGYICDVYYCSAFLLSWPDRLDLRFWTLSHPEFVHLFWIYLVNELSSCLITLGGTVALLVCRSHIKGGKPCQCVNLKKYFNNTLTFTVNRLLLWRPGFKICVIEAFCKVRMYKSWEHFVRTTFVMPQ